MGRRGAVLRSVIASRAIRLDPTITDWVRTLVKSLYIISVIPDLEGVAGWVQERRARLRVPRQDWEAIPWEDCHTEVRLWDLVGNVIALESWSP